MDWRFKAAAHNIFSYVPKGHRLNKLFQTHVTHSDRLTDASFLDIVTWAVSHMQTIKRHEYRALDELRFFEFGAGYHLIGPLTFFAYGINRQIVTDVTPLLRPDMVNQTIANFIRFERELGLPRIPRCPLDLQNPTTSLKQLYGIDYRAPSDSRSTKMPSSSFDWITSTSTLEHISPDDIRATLRECYRLLRPDGRMSMSVDYADHYAFFDTSISEYNFLRYSDLMWKLFSPPLHFQNRLRHSDYLALFQEAQFKIVEQQRRDGRPSDIATLRELRLNKTFAKYAIDDLAARGAYFVLGRGDRTSAKLN